MVPNLHTKVGNPVSLCRGGRVGSDSPTKILPLQPQMDHKGDWTHPLQRMLGRQDAGGPWADQLREGGVGGTSLAYIGQIKPSSPAWSAYPGSLGDLVVILLAQLQGALLGWMLCDTG